MAPVPATEKPCGVCGGVFAPGDLAVFGEHSVCAGCQPGFVQSLRQGMMEPVATVKEAHFAGFWIRVCAQLVDMVIVTAAQLAFGFMGGIAMAAMGIDLSTETGKLIQFIALVISFFYYFFFWTRSGATPGKMVFGLKVVDADDYGLIRNGQAVSRWFSGLLSGILLGYGFLKAGWSPQKMSLHDGIAHTRVIYIR